MGKKLAGALIAFGFAGAVLAQAPAGTTEVTADGCKLYLGSSDARGASRIRWSGKCENGLAEGRGVVRIYAGGRIARVSEATFAAGKLASPGESYFLRGGEVIRSRGGDQLQIAPSELPPWALELSMLVDDRPRAASRPAQAPKADKSAEQQRAAAEKARVEAKKAEAQKQAEAQKRQTEAKSAADNLAAERAAHEAERKRLQAERDRALAEARAAAARAAAAEKLAAEKLAAENAAQEAERKRLEAERERAVAQAKAAAEAKAAADKVAAEKAEQEAEQKRLQAERERALVEAKAAADRAAAQAKAAAEKTRFAPGRGFADGGSGAPLRGVVTFKLTTAEGRDLGIATFVAGKGEAEIRQNAAALAGVYEKTSPFKAKLLEQPEVAQTCGGPGYVLEARITYPSAKSYGWYAGCLGEDVDKAAKSMQQLEEQMQRDYKVSPASFWAYQYLIVGYVDEQNFRGRADYDGAARSNMMAPGRVMVLSKPEQWAECNDIINKDPKLKDKGACLKEALGKLKAALGLR